MNNFQFQKNTQLAAVYYNNGKPDLFRIHVDVTLVDLKHQLNQLNGLLSCRDERRVASVEYRRLSVCSDERILFTNMELQNDGDMRIVFSIFSQYSTKGLIELDAMLVRSVKDICSSLICLKTFDQIAACIVEPEEDEVEVVNLADH